MNETELEIIAHYTAVASGFYLALQEEEMKKGIDTKEYQDLLETIGGKLQLVNVLFSDMGKDCNTFLNSIVALESLLPSSFQRGGCSAISTAIEATNIFSLEINRIIDRVFFYSDSLDSKILKSVLETGTLDFIFKDEEELLMQSIRKDITKAFLYFNQSDIPSFDNGTKDLWTRVKYNLAFISVEAENFLLYERGSLPDKVSFEFSSVGEKIEATKEQIAYVQKIMGIQACKEAISSLMIPNLEDPKRTMYDNYLKSGLAILLSHHNYDKITNDLKEDLYSQKDNNQENDSMSFSHIVSTIDDFKKSNPKCKVLHFPK